MRINFFLLFVSLLFLVSCQTKPTKVYEKSPSPSIAKAQAHQIVVIDEKTIVIDARSSFEYGLYHVSGAINIEWTDFTQREEPFLGLLELDLFFHSRRLARLGIHPESKVVVLGKGKAGQGEEGRLAWTLKYLGVKDVAISSVDNFPKPKTLNEAPKPEMVSIWKPSVQEGLQVSRADFLKEVKLVHDGKSRNIILDVREPDEFFWKRVPKGIKKTDLRGAMNIPWTEFLNSRGEINSSIKSKLQNLGFDKVERIMVVSNQGVRSGLVTFALHQMGFINAANFSGGYRELGSFRKK